MKKELKTDSPAYLSVRRLEKVLSIISARSMTSLNPSYFVSHSFSSSEASLAIASLRFLGLIDSESNSTPLMVKMGFKGDDRKKALVEMVKHAYAPLFELAPGAADMEKDELHNDFMHVYKISTRVASGAVPAFVYLCEQAGLRTIKERSEKRKKIIASVKKNHTRDGIVSRKNDASLQTDSEHTIIPFSGGIKLILPTDVLTNISLIDEYKKLVSSVSMFGDKYNKSKEGNENDGTISAEE